MGSMGRLNENYQAVIGKPVVMFYLGCGALLPLKGAWEILGQRGQMALDAVEAGVMIY
jgi:hypothetical protein